MFYDPVSRLKITKTSPGMVKGKLTKKVQTALNNGHITKIQQPEYEELVEEYEKAIEKAVDVPTEISKEMNQDQMKLVCKNRPIEIDLIFDFG